MEYRPLGRTGVQVSKLCLGTMMFGAWGNADHDDSIRIIHRALDAGINFVDTADVYSAGESEEIVGKALTGPPRRRRAGHQVLHADGRRPQPARRLPALDHAVGRGLAAPPGHRPHRPLPGAPPQPDTDVEETLGALTDLVRQGKVRYIGSSSYAASQIVEAQWAARDRRLERFVTEQPPYSILVRGIEPTSCPPPSGTAWASSPTARSPAAGCPAAGARTPPRRPPRAAAAGARFDMTARANQRKLEIVEHLAQLAEQQGLTADRPGHRVRRSTIRPSPPRSSARAPWSSSNRSSPAADAALTHRVLDRIDELVAPGVTLNPDDNSYGEQVLDPALRRR